MRVQLLFQDAVCGLVAALSGREPTGAGAQLFGDKNLRALPRRNGRSFDPKARSPRGY
jgi:hypothetical protein